MPFQVLTDICLWTNQAPAEIIVRARNLDDLRLSCAQPPLESIVSHLPVSTILNIILASFTSMRGSSTGILASYKHLFDFHARMNAVRENDERYLLSSLIGIVSCSDGVVLMGDDAERGMEKLIA